VDNSQVHRLLSMFSVIRVAHASRVLVLAFWRNDLSGSCDSRWTWPANRDARPTLRKSLRSRDALSRSPRRPLARRWSRPPHTPKFL